LYYLGLAIDMWSLGCILSELLTGMPLFPGEDEADQLSCIIEIIGMPSQKLLDSSKRARNFISSKGHPRYCTVTTLPDGTSVLQGGKYNLLKLIRTKIFIFLRSF
jgi:dual specificity tyrosine-phosphorylation-regulated kinase 2/3/4